MPTHDKTNFIQINAADDPTGEAYHNVQQIVSVVDNGDGSITAKDTNGATWVVTGITAATYVN